MLREDDRERMIKMEMMMASMRMMMMIIMMMRMMLKMMMMLVGFVLVDFMVLGRVVNFINFDILLRLGNLLNVGGSAKQICRHGKPRNGYY